MVTKRQFDEWRSAPARFDLVWRRPQAKWEFVCGHQCLWPGMKRNAFSPSLCSTVPVRTANPGANLAMQRQRLMMTYQDFRPFLKFIFTNSHFRGRTCHLWRGWIVRGRYPNPGWRATRVTRNCFHVDQGCLLSQTYSPDPGCLLCEADSLNVALLLIFLLIIRRRLNNRLKYVYLF